jgi:hypothetical protein
MQPRIVFRTHYQVDEPAYMEFLIKLCTSPVQSTYSEVVAGKLASEIRTRGKEFNTAAGQYAVDLAKALDLITPNNTWTDKGHLVNLIAGINDGEWDEQLTLSLPEKLLHFRVFLEADGAALLFISRRLLQHDSLPNSDTTWNSFVREMFIEVYSDYLVITNNTADRVALRREIEQLKAKGYKGNTGSHKAFIHLQALYRLGLVDSAAPRKYQVPNHPQGMRSGLEILVNEVPDVFSLEQVVSAHKWIEAAARVFQIACVPYPETPIKSVTEKTLSLIMPYYQRVMSTGAPLCPLSTLIEAIQINLLEGQSQLLAYDNAVNLITEAQKARPKDIRFHVDRRGQPAFIKLSDDMVKTYAEKVSA